MEKKQLLRFKKEFGVVGCKDLGKAKEQLSDYFDRENTTAENEFWDNLELIEIVEDWIWLKMMVGGN